MDSFSHRNMFTDNSSRIVVDHSSGESFTNIDNQRNVPRTSTSSTIFYGGHPTFQAPAPNHGYQVAGHGIQLPFEQTARPPAADKEKQFTYFLNAAAEIHTQLITKNKDKLIEQATNYNAQMTSSNAEVARLHEENRQQLEEIRKLNESGSQWKTRYTEAFNENNVLKVTVDEQNDENENLKAEMHRTNGQVNFLTSESQNLREQLNEKEGQLQASNEQNGELKNSLAEKTAEINQLTTRTNNLLDELTTEKNEKAKAASELKKAKDELANMKSELSAKKQFAQDMIQQKLVKLGQEMQDLANKNAALNNEGQPKVVQTIQIDSDESESDDLIIDENTQDDGDSETGSLKRKHGLGYEEGSPMDCEAATSPRKDSQAGGSKRKKIASLQRH